jgi:hypothetical protein
MVVYVLRWMAIKICSAIWGAEGVISRSVMVEPDDALISRCFVGFVVRIVVFVLMLLLCNNWCVARLTP